jgi:hypothetical protein
VWLDSLKSESVGGGEDIDARVCRCIEQNESSLASVNFEIVVQKYNNWLFVL